MVGSREQEIANRQKSRKKVLEQRAQELKYWRMRDALKVKALQELWKQRDAEYFKTIHNVWEYTCTMCNRPFTTPRKLPVQNSKRCYPCTKFARQQYHRRWTEQNPEPNRERAKQWRKKQKEQPVESKIINFPQPEVVWQEDV